MDQIRSAQFCHRSEGSLHSTHSSDSVRSDANRTPLTCELASAIIDSRLCSARVSPVACCLLRTVRICCGRLGCSASPTRRYSTLSGGTRGRFL